MKFTFLMLSGQFVHANNYENAECTHDEMTTPKKWTNRNKIFSPKTKTNILSSFLRKRGSLNSKFFFSCTWQQIYLEKSFLASKKWTCDFFGKKCRKASKINTMEKEINREQKNWMLIHDRRGELEFGKCMKLQYFMAFCLIGARHGSSQRH